jgi:transcriptional regulator with XRE-family HTH domain
MRKTTDFGLYLRGQRVQAGLSVRRLAEHLGISHVYLGEVERGERGPLDRKYWSKLVKHVPGITIEGLERHAATSRPLQLEIADSPVPYQNLAFALARRIENEDLDEGDLKKLLRMLEGPARE